MNERLTTFLAASLLLLFAVGLMAGKGSEPETTRPHSEEAGPNGTMALRSWLERQGVDVRSVRTRYAEALAADAGLRPDGNILVAVLPSLFEVRVREQEALTEWLRRGNSLLLLAGIDDTPEWGGGFGSASLLSAVESLSGIGFSPATDLEDAEDASLFERLGRGRDLVMQPKAFHPLSVNISELRTRTPHETWIWVPDYSADHLLLSVATEETSGRSAAWQKPLGRGQILLVPSATLLTNASIGIADNRTFVANVLGRYLNEGGAVLLDDMHQGLSELYDPTAFFTDARLHRTLLFIACCWLIWVVGGAPRLTLAQAPAPPSRIEWLDAVSRLMQHKLAPADAGQWMIRRRIAEVLRVPGADGTTAPDWDRLRAIPTLDEREVDQLVKTYGRLRSGGDVDLVTLHNQLRRMTEAVG